MRLAAVVLLSSLRAAAQDGLDFLREEAEVISASRQSQSVRTAPATVYVVSGRRLRESGALTLWEALRGVPGLDVISGRETHGEIGIRGLNAPLNHRTLVLLDGKTVLNGFLDFVLWEALPIPLEEIDRVEIVEGPVSALYGPNAFSGVINIITKRPEAVGRLNTGVSAGTEGALSGWAMTGGPSYKLSTGWRQHEHDQTRALTSHALATHGPLKLSGGVAVHDTTFSAGSAGRLVDDGLTGFLRGDWSREGTRLRAFWNFGRSTFENLRPDASLRYDTYDAEAQHTLELPAANTLTLGAAYRRNASRSSVFAGSEKHHQDLWGLFFEDRWRALDDVTFDVSGRMDRHPHTGYSYSPRGAVVWEAAHEHTLRFSGGTAYRNPTLIDNYIELTQRANGVTLVRRGSQEVGSESITQYELAYLGRFGIYEARLAGFHYVARDFITFGPPQLVSGVFEQTAINIEGSRAWGGEAALDAAVMPGLSLYGAYGYQSVEDRSGNNSLPRSAPRHKVSAAVTGRRGGWTASTSTHWTAATGFRGNPTLQPFTVINTVSDYWLVNSRVAYAFPGGFEAAVSVQNLLDHRHRQLLAHQNGEILGRRIMGTLSWRLP